MITGRRPAVDTLGCWSGPVGEWRPRSIRRRLMFVPQDESSAGRGCRWADGVTSTLAEMNVRTSAGDRIQFAFGEPALGVTGFRRHPPQAVSCPGGGPGGRGRPPRRVTASRGRSTPTFVYPRTRQRICAARVREPLDICPFGRNLASRRAVAPAHPSARWQDDTTHNTPGARGHVASSCRRKKPGPRPQAKAEALVSTRTRTQYRRAQGRGESCRIRSSRIGYASSWRAAVAMASALACCGRPAARPGPVPWPRGLQLHCPPTPGSLLDRGVEWALNARRFGSPSALPARAREEDGDEGGVAGERGRASSRL